ncbi:hypothetical protein C8263_18365 [Deinococcus arcticus]|uniref:Uncharacterized protein n=1 Tax=Deinococcus arcticus TaxID=2136176 RepID=A0A2T3W387_9DEIO|nr:hypothetical protein C8263_18365 [Deinococcus arcticus]
MRAFKPLQTSQLQWVVHYGLHFTSIALLDSTQALLQKMQLRKFHYLALAIYLCLTVLMMYIEIDYLFGFNDILMEGL